MSDPTEVAASIPISNTGKVRLELRKLPFPPGPSVALAPKESIIMKPGIYNVVALGPELVIAKIEYTITGFKVTPSMLSRKDARFAVYVNVSEK